MRIPTYRLATILGLIALASAAVACSGGDVAMMRRHEAQMALAERAGIMPHAAAGGAAGSSDPVRLGQTVAGKYGCTACHSTTGVAGIGPTWKGLAGHEVELVNGQKLTADDAYIKESIENPAAKVHKGFAPGIMPQDIAKQMKAEEIDQVIAYIKSLK